MRAPFVLAIDQGTTSTRSIVFDGDFGVAAMAQETFPQHYPAPGWVEHDPDDLWRTVASTMRAAIAKAGLSAGDIAAIGITNQRETTIVWERETGRPVYNAIVWQDRRTAPRCEQLSQPNVEKLISERTGLLLDPYFSATKIAWILENVAGAREKAEAGALAFGTVDSFLLWRLTDGRVHATDATNASRTLLYDIHRGDWDDDLLKLFGVPRRLLPEVKDCAANFGSLARDIVGAAIGVQGIAGDQQAASIGQACFSPGMAKATYGTGCFVLLNTGAAPIVSSNKLLTTVAYQLRGRRTYAIEGSIFVAGAAVQWLRDGLGLIQSAEQSGEFAAQSDPAQPIYLVPAFVGLGAPHWDPNCRGALFGLTRSTGPREFARAALESVCYQTVDLLEAMRADGATLSKPKTFCASMEACRRPIGLCSACRTRSGFRSTGPLSMNPPRWERPTWPDCKRTSTRSRTSSVDLGDWARLSIRNGTKRCELRKWRVGGTRWRGRSPDADVRERILGRLATSATSTALAPAVFLDCGESLRSNIALTSANFLE